MDNVALAQEALRSILPYTYIVGQDRLKLALELVYIAPRIGGVLLSGKRGTAKSTIVRAFASMLYADLPVTIPINATEDRVVGGWQVKELMEGKAEPQPGLLEEAHGNLLYIDEVNLLDDHIVNIILDVTSTGKLVIQREGRNEQRDVQTTLVGTMNPEEGWLRPQLLDRFGLMVNVEAEMARAQRLKILQTVLQFDRALQQERVGGRDPFLETGRAETQERATRIKAARVHFPVVQLTPRVADACVLLAEKFLVEGHRADYLLALATCANAARYQQEQTTMVHLREVADLVLRHRLQTANQLQNAAWGVEQDRQLLELLEDA
jgi:magnesium chelatase subunit I